jgi:hypothetical protein
MKAGDLVVCNCAAAVWYKGLVGVIVGLSKYTKDPMVMYGNGEVLRLARSGLEVIS